MGYAVLHIDKARGNDSAMTAHIARTFMPSNVDSSRTHLNRELVQFPANVTNRTEAIEHRHGRYLPKGGTEPSQSLTLYPVKFTRRYGSHRARRTPIRMVQ